jgi:hypothetical protein
MSSRPRPPLRIAARVRSEPLENGQPVATYQEQVSARALPASIALAIIGGLLWLAGAKYTLLGWIAGLNWFLGWLELPARVPPPTGWYMLLMIPLGLLYSLVEIKRPWNYRNKQPEKVALYWLIWSALVASDIGSTFAGVRDPGPSAWPITLQVASSIPIAGAWSAILTFVPEWMVGGARKLLRR